MSGETAREHTQARLPMDRTQNLLQPWKKLRDTPFTGITTAGAAEPGLFALREENAPVAEMAQAAQGALAAVSADVRARMHFPVDSPHWRDWQNTELYLEDFGLRLEEAAPSVREAIMDVVRASLSPAGFQKAQSVMCLNAFLGEIVSAPGILNEWSYTFCLYGDPGPVQPWGWQLFGHHLCLHCIVIGTQMVLTPSFMGAEVTYADHGRFEGTRAFQDEERDGLAFMRGLSPDMQERARVYASMKGGDLPENRWHFADHLHLGGSFHDNRIVPYEGVTGTDLSAQQRRDLLDLVECYLTPLPDGPRSAKMGDVERHLADTHFCWIGGTGEDTPFYYRIQGPVVFIEFDHHSGVFLTNPDPAKFHVHTIVRTPNGNDYGVDLLKMHYARSGHHH